MNAGRARLEFRTERFWEGRSLSTLQRRNRQRDQVAKKPKIEPDLTRAPQRNAWRNHVVAGALPVATSLALVGVATVGLVIITGQVPLNLIPLVYMLPVVFAATRWGIVSGLIAAIAGAAAADFFFYPPIYSFWLDNRQDVIDLLLYLLVAVVTSNLAARVKNEAAAAVRREREIAELHTFSQGLATCLTSRDLIFAVQDYLSNTLKYRAVLMASLPDDSGSEKDNSAVPARVRQAAAKLIAANSSDSSIIMETLPRRAWLARIITPEILGYGAIAIELGDVTRDGLDTVVRRVEAVLREAMITLKHLTVKEAIGQATIKYQTEILRDALIGGISHELRTPLVSILGSCSVLCQMPAVRDDSQSHALVDAISGQAAQLDGEIRDLLDASRISANGVRPQLMWTDPTDIVTAAIKQTARKLGAHSVAVDLQTDSPFVHVDPVLVEQALGQLLENAAKYSQPGTSIRITSRSGKDYVDLSVSDRGKGLTAEEKNQLGQRCYRSDRHAAVPGSGLGLWIASTFVTANGGSLYAESAGPDQGATITLRVPTVAADAPDCLDSVDD